MTERKADLKFGVDGSAVKPGLEQIKRDVDGMSDDVVRSGRKASEGIEGIGKSAPQVTQKLEIEARKWVQSAQRMTAASEAGAKSGADFMEALGRRRGLSDDFMKPYITGLRQAEEAQKATAAGMGRMQVSAAQTAAALRNVPAQFTDIVVSLQAGQAPLTVLLQQGGQLKDMFGGTGAAAKALGGYVLGLVSPLTLAAAAVAAVGAGMAIVETESRKLSDINIAFKAVGREALLTGDEIKGLRREMSLLPQVSKDAAGAVITEFARTREIGADVLKGLSLRINDFAVALGQDVPAAAKTLAKAFADPAKGAKDLDDALGFLTSNQQLAINAMVEAGDKAGAQKLMLDALATATKGLAKEGTELEKATDGFSKKWTEAMGNIGDSAALRRANEVLAGIITSAGEAAVALSKMKLPDWMSLLPGGAGAGLKLTTSALGAMYPSKDGAAPGVTAPVSSQPVNWNGGKGRPTLGYSDLVPPVTMYSQPSAALGGVRIDYTPKTSTPAGAPAQTSKELDDQVKAIIEANKGYKSQKSVVEDIRKDIALTSTALKAVVADDKASGKATSARAEKLQEILGGQNEKLAAALKKGASGNAAAAKTDLDDQRRIYAELADVSSTYYKDLAAAQAQRAKGNISEKQYVDYINQLIQKQPFATALLKEQAEVAKANAKIAADANKDHAKYIEGLEKSAEAVEKQIGTMQTEEEAAALATEGYYSLAQAIEMVTIKRLEEKRDGMLGNEQALLAVQREIDARKELVGLIGKKEQRKRDEDDAKDWERDQERARKKAEEEVQRYIDDTKRGVGDAIETAIFDGSKAGGEKMREVLQEALLRKPLRMVIDGVLNQVTGGVLSMLGIGGGGGVMGGAGGGNPLGTLFSLGSSAYSTYSGLTSGQGILGSVGNYFGWGPAAANGLSPVVSTSVGSYGAVANGVVDATGAYTVSGGAGAGAGVGSLAGAGVFAAIALAVINAVGGMRSETMIGSGLRGTLDGKRNLEPWEEWREGGTIVSGPEFTNHNPLATLEEYRKKIADWYAAPPELQSNPQTVKIWEAFVSEMEKSTAGLQEQVTRQSTAINAGYNALRTNIVGMANSIGLAGSKVENFAKVLETQDLNFQGLTPEQIQEKITKVMETSGNSMAKELLGYMKPVTETVVRTVQDNAGQMGADTIPIYSQVTETTTKMVYVASQYAKAGESAYETLTRLSTSFTTLNSAMDALGYGLQEGSIALASFASDFIEAFGGLEKFTTTTSAYMQAYYSDEERRQALLRSGAAQAKKLGIDGVTAESLEQLGNAGIRAFVDGIVAGGASAKQISEAMDLAVYLAPAFQAIEQAEEPAQALADTVDELTQAFKNGVKSLKSEADNLAVEKLRASGDEAGAKRLERQQYLDGFVDEQGNPLDAARRQQLAVLYDINEATRKEIDTLNERNGLQDELNALTDTNAQALQRQRDALSESNRALFDNVQAVKLQQAIAAELPGVAGAYLTPYQQQSAGYDRVAEDLRNEGFAGVTGQALERLSKGELAGLITQVYNLGSTTDSTRLVLVRAAAALAGLKDQAADLAASRTDQAFARAEAAINKAMEASSKTIEQVKQVFDAAKNGAKDLFREVDAVAKFQGRQGRDFIAQALAQVQAGGALPVGEDFADAIAAVGKDISSTQYASQVDADYDRLVVANELKALQEVSGDQLTTEEKSLQALKDSVEWGRQQVDALRGIDSAVRDIPTAIAELALAFNTEAVIRKGGRPETLLGSGGANFDTTTGWGNTSSGVYFNADAIKAAAQGATGQQIYDAIEASGFSLREAEKIFGAAPGSLEEEARKMGLRVFHTGTPYVPETQFALLQKGEAVIPTAYNPFAHGGLGGLGGGGARLESLVSILIERVGALEVLLSNIDGATTGTHELMDRVTDGGNSMKSDVMNEVTLA